MSYLMASELKRAPRRTITTEALMLVLLLCSLMLGTAATELAIVQCNATRDTEISCREGFYRTQSSESCSWQCNQCSICGVGLNLYNDYEIRPCNGMLDTLCCLHHDMVEVDGICSHTTSTSLTPTPHTSTVAHTTTRTSDSSGNSATRTACLLSYHYIMSITMSLYKCKR